MSENTGYIVLSRQMAIQRQMDVIANNIANMSTTAFKTERVLFEEFLMETETGENLAYVRDFGTSRDVTQGEFQPTSNPLDVAISGPGYFSVETADGIRYTRSGQFRLDTEGFLITASGHKILDNAQQPISLAGGDAVLDIASDGTISNSAGTIGKLGLVSFLNEQTLLPVGDGLYQTEEAPTPVDDVSVVQGMVESSNVVPILEMTRMIQATRAYKSSTEILSKDDDIRQQTINRLGRVD
jgi:flagellar basal-body rod protein FlgF